MLKVNSINLKHRNNHLLNPQKGAILLHLWTQGFSSFVTLLKILDTQKMKNKNKLSHYHF